MIDVIAGKEGNIKQPQYTSTRFKQLIAAQFPVTESGLLCDIYGSFDADGYDAEVVVISGTKIDISELFDVDRYDRLEAKMNAELINWDQHCENLRMESQIRMRD